MPNSLIVFLLVLVVISVLLIHKMVKCKKMLVSHAIFWDILIIAIGISCLCTDELRKVATFIGIEEVSNLIFFIGFIILLVLSLVLTINISKQKSTIITLVQELAITNKRLEDINASNNKQTYRKV